MANMTTAERLVYEGLLPNPPKEVGQSAEKLESACLRNFQALGKCPVKNCAAVGKVDGDGSLKNYWVGGDRCQQKLPQGVPNQRGDHGLSAEPGPNDF